LSLFKNLLETYEKCKGAAGEIVYNEKGEADAKKTFLPIFHTTLKTQICITLDGYGNFINAVRDSKEITIIIPCTESSAGRSGSAIAAYPLCDQLDYLSDINKAKTSAYLKGLKAWTETANDLVRIKLKSICTYIDNRSMISDLEAKQIFKDTEYDTKNDLKLLNNEKIRKIGVRFIIETKDDRSPNVWEDKDLRQSWIDFIKPQSGNKNELFDYLSGVNICEVAGQHPKNINSATGNAKLLSCNTEYGFRFVGRFAKQDDAVLIDYEQSQKMHQTLRWLINKYGYGIDSQTIIVWAVDGNTTPPTEPHKNSANIFWSMDSSEEDDDKIKEAADTIYVDYTKKLKNIFQGYGDVSKIKEHSRRICIAVFDAATTGRMNLTFYQELAQNDYLENIIKWHEDTSYYLTAWKYESNGKENEKPISRHYIGAPSYDDILFAVYGKARGGNDKSYNTLKRNVRKQLLECMFGNFTLPKSMVDMAAVRASQPMSFTDNNGKFNSNDWNRGVSITCALVRKFYKKEEIKLALDETKKDRSYLYGRLLAVADKLEQTALYKADKNDTRATNAIRLMAAFSVKPYHTWLILHKQLHPYIVQLKGAGYYLSVIDDIQDLFNDQEYENNDPLSPLYLLGFSAQRRILNKNSSVKIDTTQENTEDN